MEVINIFKTNDAAKSAKIAQSIVVPDLDGSPKPEAQSIVSPRTPPSGEPPRVRLKFISDVIRRRFMSQVFSILLVIKLSAIEVCWRWHHISAAKVIKVGLQIQSLCILSFVLLITCLPDVRHFADNNRWIAILMTIVGLTAFTSMAVWEEVRLRSPYNLIVLAIFTIAQGIIVAMSTLIIPSELVMITDRKIDLFFNLKRARNNFRSFKSLD